MTTAMGIARVMGTNPLKETVLVELESKVNVELPLSEITLSEETESKPAPRPGRRQRRGR